MKRILVVEDNETNLYLIRFMLEKSGYEVIEAREGAAGVELAIKEKPDLIGREPWRLAAPVTLKNQSTLTPSWRR